MSNLLAISDDEHRLRLRKLSDSLLLDDIDVAVVADNANKFYLTGRVFSGWIVVDARLCSMTAWVQRPIDLEGDAVRHIRKIEEVELSECARVGFEFATMTVATLARFEKIISGCSTAVNASPAIRRCRAVKTPCELRLIEISGVRQTEVYRRIPSLYRPGMTDVDLQIALEGELRHQGCLGLFRILGDSMELFMGNIIAGDNADTPSPYDFAMGGAGQHPSLPVGADGTVITPGMSVMVDANGNFTGYMTDMTRTFCLGDVPTIALDAHQCSIDICRRMAEEARPGVKASHLWNIAEDMARQAGLADYFMGHRQKAGFVGHGVGIEVNEAPVLAPRSRDILEAANVIAFEPKFVIPHVGAVGIENTYAVNPESPAHCLTHAPEPILPLCPPHSRIPN